MIYPYGRLRGEHGRFLYRAWTLSGSSRASLSDSLYQTLSISLERLTYRINVAVQCAQRINRRISLDGYHPNTPVDSPPLDSLLTKYKDVYNPQWIGFAAGAFRTASNVAVCRKAPAHDHIQRFISNNKFVIWNAAFVISKCVCSPPSTKRNPRPVSVCKQRAKWCRARSNTGTTNTLLYKLLKLERFGELERVLERQKTSEEKTAKVRNSHWFRWCFIDFIGYIGFASRLCVLRVSTWEDQKSNRLVTGNRAFAS